MSEMIAERPRLGKRPSTRIPHPMTREKFLRWRPEDGHKYEFVNGQIEKTERSMTPEQYYIVRNLTRHFLTTQAFAEGGELVVETDSSLNPGEIRRPDLSLMTSQQVKACAFGEPFLPSFVIKIISKNDNINKVREKLEAYFRSGVQVVWHIFPSLQKIDVYTSAKKVVVLEGAEICSAAPAVKDFEISVNDVFKI